MYPKLSSPISPICSSLPFTLRRPALANICASLFQTLLLSPVGKERQPMLARMTGFSWKPAANQRQEMLRFHIYAQEVTPKVAKEIPLPLWVL